ncbi:DNA repair protein RadA [Methanofollis formosanus]|uniref:DNA repair protein RadA n=1 Tax=Methanofollis formosanus TaxID=299308 RepID=UPI001C7D22C2|nr:DNA repair protein RadA [Methanofollis formosanus]
MPDVQRGPPGRGQGRRGVPPGTCVCPACGYEKPKVMGVPCRETECPKCGVPMMGK